MSNARPITIALKELRKTAEELREAHTKDGQWPESEFEARFEYYRIINLCNRAEKEFKDLRQKELRVSRYESSPEESAA